MNVLQNGTDVALFHLVDGILMREDMHEDLVFLIHIFCQVADADDDDLFWKAKKAMDKRFPGHYVTTPKFFRGYIYDCLLIALWPWRTGLVVSNPRHAGGTHSKVPFHEVRLAALQGTSPRLSPLSF